MKKIKFIASIITLVVFISVLSGNYVVEASSCQHDLVSYDNTWSEGSAHTIWVAHLNSDGTWGTHQEYCSFTITYLCVITRCKYCPYYYVSNSYKIAENHSNSNCASH